MNAVDQVYSDFHNLIVLDIKYTSASSGKVTLVDLLLRTATTEQALPDGKRLP